MQAWHQPFTVLKAQMTVKASKDSDYTRFLTELKDIMVDQEAFMNELYIWISECASLDKAEVTIFSVKKIYIALRQLTTKTTTRPMKSSLMRSWRRQKPGFKMWQLTWQAA